MYYSNLFYVLTFQQLNRCVIWYINVIYGHHNADQRFQMIHHMLMAQCAYVEHCVRGYLTQLWICETETHKIKRTAYK